MTDRSGEKGAARLLSVVITSLAVLALAAAAARFLLPGLDLAERVSYSLGFGADAGAVATSTSPEPKPAATHLPTPDPVKALYMTACIAGTPSYRDKILREVSGTEINSIVIDIKDYTGTISYASTTVDGPRGKGCLIYDLPEFIAELHAKGIYAIGRITVFQDPLYSAAHPEIAVQSISKPGKPWTDRKGLAYVDPDFPSYWDHVVSIAEEAHSIGFDEINFDYIRFPSDGDMSDAEFALPASTTKAMVITDFFAYLHSKLSPDGIKMSADIFGQTTVDTDDLGIGQILEDALPYFDFVSPMVYPSHFVNGFEGFPNPAEHPYEIVKNTMTTAVERAVAASSTPDKFRPWLQAFDLGAAYTPEMVHKEMQAVYDSGLKSWMIWDAANNYNKQEF